ncbi:MAG: Flp pilus assembly complex ATPase component TadA [Thermoflavifilum sp.]|nr:Flp pilus assembly complex ATPase component TadA [Thermoflavifilum sp.]MCL6513986.1 Flp pilus assembly complex ATPase component TadA [Alicyclobacillus sp.]
MDEQSAVSLLSDLLRQALQQRATDVHLRIGASDWSADFRVGGDLRQVTSGSTAGPALARRVKALARMDVADSRQPQDGGFHWEDGDHCCDVRVAALPTVYGEAVVLRLLPKLSGAVDFTELGMTVEQARDIRQLLSLPSGLVLVAGPTGAGKTTTLYTMMRQLAAWRRRVVSIEDPVEMILPDCHQVQVRERTGLTFDAGLRALLRQDPDVIMVSEIRDEVTARTVLRAALSGHLVLSTTHARDASGAVLRLEDFGLSRFVVRDVLRAVVVQVLHPALCVPCDGRGCEACFHTGWSPIRRASFQIIRMDEAPRPVPEGRVARLVGRSSRASAGR